MATKQPAAPSVDQQVMSSLQSQFGYLASFLTIPDLSELFQQATSNGWSQDELLAHLQATDWYKQHSAAARQWVALQKTDPGEAQSQLEQRQAAITQKAASSGLTLDPSRLQQIATDSLQFGWSDQQLQAAIGAEFHYNPNVAQPTSSQSVMQLAKQYLVPVSPDRIQSWTQQMIGGQMTQDDLKMQLAQQAASLYPSMKNAIDMGDTPAQFVDPYKQIAAQTLEISPDTIDFMDPKWNKAINQIDPKTNNRIAMNLSDWTNELRSNPTYGYDLTNNARTQAAQFETQLLQKMGAA